VGTIIDIVLCLIALCFILPGFRIGFVRSLVELVGSIFAIIVSSMLANRFIATVCVFLFKTKSVNVLNYAIAKIITTIVIYILLQLLVNLAARALDTIFRLPVLHQVNSLLGGIFGLLKGVLVVFLLCAVLQLTLPLIAAKYPNVTAQKISQSRIYQYVYVNNPIYQLFQAEI
jgi:membrane protein required for colicin V production